MNTSLYDLKKSLIADLQTLPVCKVDNTSHYVTRCPYCNDSNDPTHGHFSILIDLESDRPIMYRCLKCDESGIFVEQTYEDLGLGYNEMIYKNLHNYNKGKRNGGYYDSKTKSYIIPIPKPTENNYSKLNYINNRLGTHIDLNNCIEYKIVTNLSEFLKANEILTQLSDGTELIKAKTIRELSNNYVGFLSANNNKITFRDITGQGFFGRYFKLTIDPTNLSPNTFYSLSNKFDLLYNKEINLHVAEGTFDILSVYFNLQEKIPQNSLFFASCGYNYTTIIKYLIYMGVTSDIHLHLYSDNDKSDKDHLTSFRDPFYKIWIDKITVHRNVFEGEKDFGVRKENILEQTYKLKLR